jgi:PAS domain S-box-containing protein
MLRVQNEELAQERRTLAQTHDRYVALYDFGPIPYVTLTSQGIIEEINLTGCKMLGTERSRIMGFPLLSFIFPPDRRKLIDHLMRCRRGAATMQAELRLLTRQGAVVPAQLSSTRAPSMDGRGVSFRTAITDLTELKVVEEERNQLIIQEQAARAANQAKDEFLAMVSHELRTPLSAVLLWSRLLSSGKIKDAEREEAIGAIEHSAKAQQQLIDDLLDVSRALSGKLRLEMHETQISPAIEAAIEAVRPMALAKGVRLKSRLQETGLVRADLDRMQQVVWNLVTNAVKFTARGGTVEVRLHQAGEFIEISVKDTGRGILPDFLPYVFDRFRQYEEGSTRGYGGLGLGLAIAKQLVEAHGGTIHAQSAGRGKGSLFTTLLPLVTSVPPLDEPMEEAKKEQEQGGQGGAEDEQSPLACAPAREGGLRGIHVVLAEDEPLTRHVIERVLQQAGARVTAVASAREAREVLASFIAPPAPPRPSPLPESQGGAGDGNPTQAKVVLISDIAMPEEDGLQLIRSVRQMEARGGQGGERQHSKPIPAASLSALVTDGDRDASLAAGFQMHVAKPIEPDDLVNIVADLAGRRRVASTEW